MIKMTDSPDLQNNMEARESAPMNHQSVVVDEVSFGSGTLVRREPVVLQAATSECQKYFTIEAEDLGMTLSEPSLEELKEAYDSVLRVVWRKYAMGDPQDMTPAASAFRKQLASTYTLI